MKLIAILFAFVLAACVPGEWASQAKAVTTDEGRFLLNVVEPEVRCGSGGSEKSFLEYTAQNFPTTKFQAVTGRMLEEMMAVNEENYGRPPPPPAFYDKLWWGKVTIKGKEVVGWAGVKRQCIVAWGLMSLDEWADIVGKTLKRLPNEGS